MRARRGDVVLESKRGRSPFFKRKTHDFNNAQAFAMANAWRLEKRLSPRDTPTEQREKRRAMIAFYAKR